jgi:VanZ family protein
MTIKHLLAPNKLWFWLAATWTLFIVIMCLKPAGSETIVSFRNADKIAHFSFYFVFVVLWYKFLSLLQSKYFKNYFVIIIAIVFSILIEIAQKTFTNSRQGDFWDVLANSVGALVGFFAVSKISKA